jgi:hypothetical protein
MRGGISPHGPQSRCAMLRQRGAASQMRKGHTPSFSRRQGMALWARRPIGEDRAETNVAQRSAASQRRHGLHSNGHEFPSFVVRRHAAQESPTRNPTPIAYYASGMRLAI